MSECLEVVIPIPQAWNIGPMPKTDAERAAADAAAAACPPTSILRVFLPGDHFVRMETGKKDALVLIYKDGRVVGMFGPETVAAIVAFWRAHDVVGV